MMPIALRGPLLLLGVFLSGCGATGQTGYRFQLAEADRAYSAGRFQQAAQAFEHAASEAGEGRDGDDALYRAALAYRRAGDRFGARRLLTPVAARGGLWENGARARLELASLGLESELPAEVAAANRALTSLIGEAPDTGPARGALRIRLRSLDALDPTHRAAIVWLSGLVETPRIRQSVLFESVLAERAIRVEVQGDRTAAEIAWRSVVELVPYPQNSHWDDGHLALARLQRAGQRPHDAVATLDRMLAVREASWGNGSYAAPGFDDGALLEAEILRDDLHQVAAAAAAFHRVYTDHPTSRRRDDALWAEAALRRSADPAAACQLWRLLVAEFPCQRFAARAREALTGCTEAAPVPSRCVDRN